MYKIMGEAGGKSIISATQGDSMITYIQKVQCMSKKSLPSIMGLVIGRTKHCCINITLSITKSNAITLFLMIFFWLEVLLPTSLHFIPLLGSTEPFANLQNYIWQIYPRVWTD